MAAICVGASPVTSESRIATNSKGELFRLPRRSVETAEFLKIADTFRMTKEW
ncbi:hypothetical protein HGRIS_008109 [Hohenbuehelia grisea]|uniref:Uncharacterized protein n=1 Tax=Hohenbuehelia grisea TaxID=104357 RepID=A0ABR3J768_9AGAR